MTSDGDLSKLRVGFGGVPEDELSGGKKHDRQGDIQRATPGNPAKEAEEDAKAKEREEARPLAARDEVRVTERSIHANPSTHALPLPPCEDRRGEPLVGEERG